MEADELDLRADAYEMLHELSEEWYGVEDVREGAPTRPILRTRSAASSSLSVTGVGRPSHSN